MTDATRESEAAEVAALFERLREEVAERPQAAASGVGLGSVARGGFSASARHAADRYWAVTADRPFLYKPGPWGRVRGLILAPPKIVLRKLMRWYLEPALTQQRQFNAAVLRALDELGQQMDALASEVTRPVDERPDDLRGEHCQHG
jgi:hypothetical protein